MFYLGDNFEVPPPLTAIKAAVVDVPETPTAEESPVKKASSSLRARLNERAIAKETPAEREAREAREAEIAKMRKPAGAGFPLECLQQGLQVVRSEARHQRVAALEKSFAERLRAYRKVVPRVVG